MYVKRSDLHLSDDEIATFLAEHQWGRLGTVSSDGEPHVSPLGYLFSEGRVWFHSLMKSRRGRHVGDEARVALCVDDGVGEGETYSQRRGVVVYGICRKLAADDPRLDGVRAAFAERFFGDAETEYERKTHAWYEVEPYRFAWDFGRIPSGADRFGGQAPGRSVS